MSIYQNFDLFSEKKNEKNFKFLYKTVHFEGIKMFLRHIKNAINIFLGFWRRKIALYSYKTQIQTIKKAGSTIPMQLSSIGKYRQTLWLFSFLETSFRCVRSRLCIVSSRFFEERLMWRASLLLNSLAAGNKINFYKR